MEKQICMSKERMYGIWYGMKTRCNNPKHESYRWYGEKGIKVCEQWEQDYYIFKNWSLNNGYLDNLTIDRIDSKGNYEPSNCRWATTKQQANNVSSNVVLEYHGKSQNMIQWCEELGLNYVTVKSRISILNKETAEAFEKPIARRNDIFGEGVERIGSKIYLTFQNKSMPLKEWASEINWEGNVSALATRARNGWTAEKILTTEWISSMSRKGSCKSGKS